MRATTFGWHPSSRSLKTMAIAGVALGSLLATVASADAADRFVSRTGSDSGNDCLTSAAPCRTITHALTQAVDTDAVKVTQGTYAEEVTIGVSVALSGGWLPDFSAQASAQSAVQRFESNVGAGQSRQLTIDNFTVSPVTLFGLRLQAIVDANLEVTLTRFKVARGETGIDISAHTSGVVDVDVSGYVATGVFRALNWSQSNTGSNTLTVTGSSLRGRADGPGIEVAVFGAGALHATIEDSTIEKWINGIVAHNSDTSQLEIDIVRTAFERNRRRSEGNGIQIFTSTGTLDFSLRESLLTKNGGRSGSGVSIEHVLPGPGSITAAIENTAFIKNKAVGGPFGGLGGAIFVDGQNASLALTNVTLSGNQAVTGGGIYAAGGTIDLKNTIAWGNRLRGPSAGGGADLHMEESSPGTLVVNADHSDIGERVTVSGTFNDLGDNIDADPLLLRPNGGYRLAAGSPAIDTGTCVGAPSIDIAGNPRPTGTGCDMGAHEFQP